MSKPPTFLTLPSELRNKIYTTLLVRNEPLKIWHHEANIDPTILRVNKQIHQEASFQLYSRNTFDFAGGFYLLTHFADGMGKENASLIGHIRLEFPTLDRVSPRSNIFKISDFSARVLGRIQSHFVNVKNLTVPANSFEELAFQLGSTDVEGLGAVLGLVNAWLCAISSVERVVVEVYAGLDVDVRRVMEGLGWHVRTVEREKKFGDKV
ncbi:hypothetical protein BJY04DRAFT_176702 [Aspergillus karnatakaensis]|uniref:uncharacterized protein n=1 Tax=Aspergillus karnatakaensis TaxID=1810916 RepID=UPI003CCD51C1